MVFSTADGNGGNFIQEDLRRTKCFCIPSPVLSLTFHSLGGYEPVEEMAVCDTRPTGVARSTTLKGQSWLIYVSPPGLKILDWPSHSWIPFFLSCLLHHPCSPWKLNQVVEQLHLLRVLSVLLPVGKKLYFPMQPERGHQTWSFLMKRANFLLYVDFLDYSGYSHMAFTMFPPELFAPWDKHAGQVPKNVSF